METKMYIKENFYSKLENLREAKKPSWEKEGSWSKQMKKQEKYAMKKLTPKAKAARDAAAEKKLEEEQLNELRGKGTVDKKEMQAHIRKKHGKAWDDTIDIRRQKKSAGPADTKDMDKYRNRLAKMHNKLDESEKEMKLPKEYGKILPRPDVKSRKVIKKSGMDKRAAKAGMKIPKGYGDIVTYNK